MNISPLPQPDDVVVVAPVKVVVSDVGGQDSVVEMSLAAFQDAERPPLLAYGLTEKAAVVALYNRLFDEVYEGEEDDE